MMDIKVFIVNDLPGVQAFGDAVENAIRHQTFPLWLQVRLQETQGVVGDQQTLLIERINHLKIDEDHPHRFYVYGRTGDCKPARKGQFVQGWLDDKQGSGELLVSDAYIG